MERRIAALRDDRIWQLTDFLLKTVVDSHIDYAPELTA